MASRAHDSNPRNRSRAGFLGGFALGAALTLVLADPLQAALLGRIRGTIKDLAGGAVPGILVRLSSPQLGVVDVTNTDGKGVYGFSDLEAGSYNIEVSGSGYQSQIKKGIVVQPPFRNIVDFTLPAGPLLEGQGSPVIYEAPTGEVVLKEVVGTITDKDKRPIPDALVSLVNPATGASFRVQTGREGKVKIDQVPVGTYKALVASPGYVTMELKPVFVTKEWGLVLNLSLVEYPLRFQGRPTDFIPEERPVPPDYTPPSP
ncbi:MAG TPA: carboxypeptidase-like regulatory domain-containing protein [Candidatus Polarisedimenticolia bacterium]|nr:carboxypeptidase-like regulatory domain-containing protein [Candidatus Polarisedimenticolia bacterium]